MARKDLGEIWSRSGLGDYYECHRVRTEEVYPSEWFFLKEVLAEGISILDIGCAAGGFASIAGEHLTRYSYTGVDVSAEMIARAKRNHPQHRFHQIEEGDLSVLGGERFELVLCLGVLHLTPQWRTVLDAAWAHTKGVLVVDLRETYLETTQDEAVSYMVMDFKPGQTPGADLRLPYNIINAGEALRAVVEACRGAVKLRYYGCMGGVSDAARTPVGDVFMSTYCIERGN